MNIQYNSHRQQILRTRQEKTEIKARRKILTGQDEYTVQQSQTTDSL